MGYLRWCILIVVALLSWMIGARRRAARRAILQPMGPIKSRTQGIAQPISISVHRPYGDSEINELGATLGRAIRAHRGMS